MQCKCQRCGYTWQSAKPDKKPVSCPACKRYDWDKVKKEDSK